MSTSLLAQNVVRSVVAMTAIAAIGLGVSACGAGGPSAGTFDKTDDFSWKTTVDAKNVAPDWIPATAGDIKERARTTGNERILAYRGTITELPSTCTSLPLGTDLVPRPDNDRNRPGDFKITATLTADWWPAGQEGKTTAMCGKWWVSSDGERVYAFTPELKVIAERLSQP
jgi:hypothetical protein